MNPIDSLYKQMIIDRVIEMNIYGVMSMRIHNDANGSIGFSVREAIRGVYDKPAHNVIQGTFFWPS